MTREVVCRIVLSFDKLNGGIKSLQLKPDALNMSWRLALGLFHHMF